MAFGYVVRLAKLPRGKRCTSDEAYSVFTC